MKSVGEVMAIGRTFAESMQKALRGLETGLSGLDEIEIPGLGDGDDKNAIRAALVTATPDRLRMVAQSLREGATPEEVHQYSKFDLWYIEQFQNIIASENRIREHGLPQDDENLRMLKAQGFADSRLAELADTSEKEVTALRTKLDVHPVYKRIDTSAAEFASPFAGTVESEAQSSDREKVMILGGGPNRIGQGIEFDYCCCHAAFALEDADFEPLTAEDVMEIVRVEQSNGTLKGVIVQFGGQTPLKLAQFLTENNVPILGTSPDKIDLAEDRDRFQKLLQDLEMLQPRNGIARSADEARTIVKEIGYPVVIRPSYVLGGRAMEIVRTDAGFERYINEAVVVSGDTPVLIDSYLSGAIEVDVDCLCDGENVKVCGIMEHIEEAGIHSGDSACSLPTHSLPQDVIDELIVQSKKMALALEVSGLMNMQYAIKDGEIFVLEVNPRASRTVPFVAKTIGCPIAKIASRIMAGETVDNAIKAYGEWREAQDLKHIAVKEAVFPFARFPGVDILLGPEMRSTGEVMGLDTDYPMAYAKAVLGAGTTLPTDGNVFISVKDSDKDGVLQAARTFVDLGFKLMATGGTQRFFEENGLECKRINKVLEGRPHIEDAIHNGQVQLVINTTEGAKAMSDSRSLRQAALKTRTAHTTTLTAAIAMSQSMEALSKREMEVRSLQEYLG